jgi:hypothetical protein
MNSKLSSEKGLVKKIDFYGALNLAIDKLKEIRASNLSNGAKSQSERRLGKSCLIKLAGRSSRSNGNKASLSYLNREVTKLRTAIRLEGFIRHDANSKLMILINDSPLAVKELSLLIDIQHNYVKDVKSNVVDKLSARESRTKNVENKKQLKRAISAIKKLNFEPHVFETLIRTNEQKVELKQSAVKRVEEYHEKQREVNYANTYRLMSTLLASSHDWQALTFGLVLASGRRSAEILCEKDGAFEQTNNQHEAIFTSTVKTKDAKTYKIPLLVDFKTFNDALQRLRNTPRIFDLMDRVKNIESYDIRHQKVNSSVQQQLNEFVKKSMGGQEWVLKDGRAMFARLAYAEYCATEKKAGRLPMTDDLFFKRKLGHSDAETQQNYKRFTLTGEAINNREVKRTKQEAEEKSNETRDRLSELKEMFKLDDTQSSRAFLKYAEFTVKEVEANPVVKITSTLIKSKLGGNKGIISKFVKLVKEAGLQKPF